MMFCFEAQVAPVRCKLTLSCQRHEGFTFNFHDALGSALNYLALFKYDRITECNKTIEMR